MRSRRRGAQAASLVVALFTACARGGAGTPAPPGASATGPSPSPSARTSPPIVLTADADEAPAAWTVAATIPYGDGEHELAYRPSQESAPVEPASFAIDADGSIWILDVGKGRLAHFTTDGTYVGQATGIAETATDVIAAGGQLLVIQDQTLGAAASVAPAGDLAPFTIAAEGQPLQVQRFVPSSIGVVAESGGLAADPGQGPRGFVLVQPSGDATLLPGLPLAGQTSFTMATGAGDGDLVATFASASTTLEQPIEIRLTSKGEERTAVVGASNFIPQDSDVSMTVQVSEAVAGAQPVGGRWLLRVGAGSSQVLWERLPDPGIDDDAQVRHLTVDQAGHLFLMVLGKEGVQILERP